MAIYQKICQEEYNLCESFIIVLQSAQNAHFSCYAALLYKIFPSSLLSVSHFLVHYILVFFYFG